MVFATVGLAAMGLALAGLIVLRVYDSHLVRQTESELIAQGVAVAEAFREALRAELGGDVSYGAPRTEPWPFPAPADSDLTPILPLLRASDDVLPAATDPPAAPLPADARARRAGERLSPMLGRITRSTLAGIRVVDPSGVVIATGREGLGTSLAYREEVALALRGAPKSVLRRRVTDHGEPPYASLSRETGLRVSVALPVLEGDRVWGAVLVSRTPMTLAKAVYADRWHLPSRLLVVLAVVALVSVSAAAFVARPVRALLRQTRAIGRGDASGFTPIARPVVSELAELSDTLASMASALRDRNDYIRTFAANVSHEFKTPLASIQGAVELLSDHAESLSAEQRERFLKNIEADAQRLTRLVERLLDLARADAMGPTPASVEARPLLEALAGRARTEGIQATLGGLPERMTLRVPEEVLDAVVWQLISNAKQHGGEAVCVRIALESGHGHGAVRIVVHDDGPGISEANRARVFDAFFTTARERGGTGLGLTIARSLLHPFGGRLDLLPGNGPGAAFAITLPA